MWTKSVVKLTIILFGYTYYISLEEFIMTDLEKKYFELSVLGVLADRNKMSLLYNKEIPKNQSIIDFFLDIEKCTMLDIESWYEKHNSEILRIRSLVTKDRINGFNNSRDDFLKWYLGVKNKKCCYCGVKEEDLKSYFNEENPQYYIDDDNKARQRGKFLEIERLQTVGSKNRYNPENTDLACYVCNNAKSDFISPKSFKPIAEGINVFWNKILSQEKKVDDNLYFNTYVKFPEDSNVWTLD